MISPASGSDLSCWTKILLSWGHWSSGLHSRQPSAFFSCEDSRVGELGSVGDTRLTRLGTTQRPWHTQHRAAPGSSWPLTPLPDRTVGPVQQQGPEPKTAQTLLLLFFPVPRPPSPALLTSPPSPWPGWSGAFVIQASRASLFRPSTTTPTIPSATPAPARRISISKFAAIARLVDALVFRRRRATLGRRSGRWWASRGCRCLLLGPPAPSSQINTKILERRAFWWKG